MENKKSSLRKKKSPQTEPVCGDFFALYAGLCRALRPQFRKSFSFLLREGWRSFLRALASI